MVQRGENLRFPLEPGEAVWVGGERFGEDLERNLALELRISRLIDLPHAAFADEGGHVVVPESRADLEGHRLSWNNRRRSEQLYGDGALISHRRGVFGVQRVLRPRVFLDT